MSQSVKSILTYLFLILLTLGVIRIYDYITRDPTPIVRTENPEVIALNKRIDILLDSVASDKRKSAKAMENFYLSLDSVKSYRKTAINESKKLKATPDSMLQHRMDSIFRANRR